MGSVSRSESTAAATRAAAASLARQSRGPAAWLARRNFERILSILSPLILLGIWELAARTQRIDVRFFPAPSVIVQSATTLVKSGVLWSDVSITVTRIAVGFTIGAVPGIILGLAMGLFGPVRAVFMPLVDGTFPIPKIAVLPLLYLVFGLGEASKYAIIAIAVVYLVLINTLAGVRNIERVYLDVGKNFHASRLMMFTDIALPGALPMVFTGLKLGMGVALLVIVAAEFVGAHSGIGYLIWISWQEFQVEQMYVGFLVCALLGFVSAGVLTVLERILIPWKRA